MDNRLRVMQRRAIQGDPGAAIRLNRMAGRIRGYACMVGHQLQPWTVIWERNGVYCVRKCFICKGTAVRIPATPWDEENAPTNDRVRWEPWAIIHGKTTISR